MTASVRDMTEVNFQDIRTACGEWSLVDGVMLKLSLDKRQRSTSTPSAEHLPTVLNGCFASVEPDIRAAAALSIGNLIASPDVLTAVASSPQPALVSAVVEGWV